MDTTYEDVHYLERMVPIPLQPWKPISIILASIHTLAVTEGVTTVFREWDRRVCRIQVPEGNRSALVPTVFPEGPDPRWAHGLLGLNSRILSRILGLALPGTIDQLRAAMTDLEALTGTEGWLIDFILKIFEFVRVNPQFWRLLLLY